MDTKTISWMGEDGLRWEACMGIDNESPCILELKYEKNGQWLLIGSMLYPKFRVITAKRTTVNPQRVKERTADEKTDYQWDTYSDDPFSHKENVKQSDSCFQSKKMHIVKEENHTTVIFDGLTMGNFSGTCEFHFFDGTNLIRMEACASTQENGVAYLYHAGLDGFQIGKLYYISPR